MTSSSLITIMKYRILNLALISLIFCACQPSTPSLIGSWENTSLTVTMKLDNGQDSLMLVPEGSWADVLKIKPIVTNYAEDGTFKSEYFSLEGDPIGTEAGTWKMKGDSLILNSAGYDNAYQVSFEGDNVRFTSLLDWDQDGQPDDLYDGWQKRVDKD